MSARGLTLLETVAAAALLALLGVTGASLLVDARQRVNQPESPVAVHDLSRLAEALIEDPAAVGGSESVAELDGIALPWPASFEMPDAPHVTLRLVKSDGFLSKEVAEEEQPRGRARAWLVFECGRVSTARWVELLEEAP
jgi:hypothetical protein